MGRKKSRRKEAKVTVENTTEHDLVPLVHRKSFRGMPTVTIENITENYSAPN